MQDFTTFLANHPLLSMSASIVFVLVMFVELIRARRAAYDISAQDVTQLINHENATLIDLRASDEFAAGHIIHSLNMPAHALRENPKSLAKYRLKPLILISNDGRESQKLAAFLLKNGYNVYSLVGGFRTWQEAQLPLVKG
jgi:rhodanese-related sulfurtransferase